LYAEKGDLKQSQEFLGHAQIATTAESYTHLDQKVIEQGVETVAEAIWPGPIECRGVTGFNEKSVSTEEASRSAYCGLSAAPFF